MVDKALPVFMNFNHLNVKEAELLSSLLTVELPWKQHYIT